MKYDSQFSIGQEVWMVRSEGFNRIVKCSPCTNTGKIKIGEEDFICPKCSGRSAHYQSAGEKFYVYDSSTVGKITIEDCPGNYRAEEPNPRVTYMVHATGVGSGQIWEQERLFSSKEEAQLFCDSKNGILPVDETQMREAPVDTWGRVLDAKF